MQPKMWVLFPQLPSKNALAKNMHNTRVRKYTRTKRASPISTQVKKNTPAQDRGAQGVQKMHLVQTQVPKA